MSLDLSRLRAQHSCIHGACWDPPKPLTHRGKRRDRRRLPTRTSCPISIYPVGLVPKFLQRSVECSMIGFRYRPHSSGDRAPPSGGGCAGSNPAGGARSSLPGNLPSAALPKTCVTSSSSLLDPVRLPSRKTPQEQIPGHNQNHPHLRPGEQCCHSKCL